MNELNKFDPVAEACGGQWRIGDGTIRRGESGIVPFRGLPMCLVQARFASSVE